MSKPSRASTCPCGNSLGDHLTCCIVHWFVYCCCCFFTKKIYQKQRIELVSAVYYYMSLFYILKLFLLHFLLFSRFKENISLIFSNLGCRELCYYILTYIRWCVKIGFSCNTFYVPLTKKNIILLCHVCWIHKSVLNFDAGCPVWIHGFHRSSRIKL